MPRKKSSPGLVPLKKPTTAPNIDADVDVDAFVDAPLPRVNARRALPTVEQIESQLAEMSREPFREVLASVLCSAPSPEALAALAEKSPDRWGQLVAMIGRLAGYNEKLEVEGNIKADVKELSDAELVAKVAALSAGIAHK